MNHQDLKAYVDMRFTALIESITDTRRAMEYRLEGMNEFRDSLRDQTIQYVPKTECAVQVRQLREEGQRLSESLRSLELTRAAVAGKASRTEVLISWIISACGLLVSIAAIVVSLISRN